MAFIPLLAMVRKDLQLFFSDRRSVIVSFVVPIAIASFFGSIFSGPSNSSEPAKISIAVVDHDGSAISKAILSGAQRDKNLKVATPSEDEARDLVKNGKTSVAVVIPKGFGEAAGSAFFGGGEKPALGFLYDPSRNVGAGDGARRDDAARHGGGQPARCSAATRASSWSRRRCRRSKRRRRCRRIRRSC